MRNINLSISIAFCVFITATGRPAGAITRYVSPSGSIQAAIDDANNGDAIEVAPGTYYESVDFIGKAVRLYSSAGAEVTTIDGTGHYHVVRCSSGEGADTILEGFTITGGNANGPDPNNMNGGGMFNYNSSPTVTNCTFSGNFASNGGGMVNYNNSSPTVTNCTFTGNSADGGGMSNLERSSPTVTNCTFTRNEGGESGGMGNYNNSSPTVTNCTFSWNSAQYDKGGGMGNYHNSSPTVTNCTFSGNEALNIGGGIFDFNNSIPTVTNCILWGDTPDEIHGNPTVTYSDVQGGWAGTGNVSGNPMFVDVAGGNLSLFSQSPCIDAGDNGSLPDDTADLDDDGNTAEPIPFDLLGNPRVVDGNGDGSNIVDMGAFELQARVHNITQSVWYITIQAAIDDANDGDVIEVEPGTYGEAINLKGKAITLRSTDPNDPNVVAGTIIDANGLGSSAITCNTNEGPDTMLAGFTITRGHAAYGGGMYCDSASPMVTNCVFSYNVADCNGGGMHNFLSSPVVVNCVFYGNSTRDGQDYEYPGSGLHGNSGGHAGHGAGIYNDNSSPFLSCCEFIENRTGAGGKGQNGSNGGLDKSGGWGGAGGNGGDGAGMYNYWSTPTVFNCCFSLNETGGGGGAGNGGRAGWSFWPAEFSNHGGKGGRGGAGGDGAGMYNHNSSPVVINCRFTENKTGLGVRGGQGGNVSDSLVDKDDKDNGGDGGDGGDSGCGAGMYNNAGNPEMINCTFSGNRTNRGGDGGNGEDGEFLGGNGGDGGDSGSGAGMYNIACNPIVTNCTFTGNLNHDLAGRFGFRSTQGISFYGKSGSKGVGAGIYSAHSSPTVTNCVMWGDLPDEIYDINSTPTITYSDIQNGYTGEGNISDYPKFVNILEGDLRLMACSSCIDAGNNAAVPPEITTDLAGNPRFVDDGGVADTGTGTPPIVDMGAYELQTNTLIWPVYNITRNTPYCGIQLAIDDAENGNEIVVQPGTYHEAVDFKGKAITLRSTNPSDRSVVAATIIDGDGLKSPVVTCADNEGNDTILAGFTITGGEYGYGGGMYNYRSCPTITDCIFTANLAGNGGGMSNFYKSSPSVSNCTFRGNSAIEGGGGMSNTFSSNPTVTNCTFIANEADSSGGGIDNFVDCKPTVVNCTFIANISNIAGGGICNLYDCQPTVTNCTFIGNFAVESGGGLCNLDSNSIVANSVVWDNLPDAIYNYSAESIAIVTYSDIQGGCEGEGNIDADPRFEDTHNLDPNLWNLRLRPGSPCIDSGDNDAPNLSDADYDGLPRVLDGNCDGADIVDMGAYEFNFAFLGDLDYNCLVDFGDFAVFGPAWLAERGQDNYDPACDISYPTDDVINWSDLTVIAENWLTNL